MVVTRLDVLPGGGCLPRSEEWPVGCGEQVEVRLLSPPCPAKPPRRPESARRVTSAGLQVFTGEVVKLRVVGRDRCGNEADAGYDPASGPSPLCDETLPDGTCCPAVRAPRPGPCPVSRCSLP
jgi:hypothetical protein